LLVVQLDILKVAPPVAPWRNRKCVGHTRLAIENNQGVLLQRYWSMEHKRNV